MYITSSWHVCFCFVKSGNGKEGEERMSVEEARIQKRIASWQETIKIIKIGEVDLDNRNVVFKLVYKKKSLKIELSI